MIDPALAATALTDGGSPRIGRERQVLQLAASGATTAEIAAAAALTPGTVRNYLSEAIQKVGAQQRGRRAHRRREGLAVTAAPARVSIPCGVPSSPARASTMRRRSLRDSWRHPVFRGALTFVTRIR